MNANKLIAHRGDNTNYPENTLVAIEAALNAGASSFEFDVQMNADHSLLAFHDADVERMTGNRKDSIFDLSDKQVSELSIHEPDQFGEKHKPTSVTHLKEITDLLKRFPKAQAYVEIKEESLNHFGNNFVMQKLLNQLKGFEEQATIISFSAEALAYTKTNSSFRIGFVFEDFSQKTKDIATDLAAEFMVTWYKVLPQESLWKGDWQWMVYTVNDIALAGKLLARGDIDLVETDDIQMMLGG